jgi:hypothetical protein
LIGIRSRFHLFRPYAGTWKRGEAEPDVMRPKKEGDATLSVRIWPFWRTAAVLFDDWDELCAFEKISLDFVVAGQPIFTSGAIRTPVGLPGCHQQVLYE